MSKASIMKAVSRDKRKALKKIERTKIRQCVNCNCNMTIEGNKIRGHNLFAYHMGSDKVCPDCYMLSYLAITCIYMIRRYGIFIR